MVNSEQVASKYLYLNCILLSLESSSLSSLMWKVNLDCDFGGINGKHRLCVVLTVLLDHQPSQPTLTTSQTVITVICQQDSHKFTENIEFDWCVPFLIHGKRLEPHLSLWSTVNEFKFSETGGKKNKLCIH